MNNKKRLRELTREVIGSLAQTFEIEEGMLSGEMTVEMVGRRSCRLTNHRGIIKYTPEEVRIKTESGVFRVCGEMLKIKGLMAEEIIIEGIIENAAYEEV
ncbi:MAG: hypothetical protein GX061_03430 [Eubacteriaceae bacterium]|nr:hypothetical protein [Eubacteriaceae bacterium]